MPGWALGAVRFPVLRTIDQSLYRADANRCFSEKTVLDPTSAPSNPIMILILPWGRLNPTIPYTNMEL